MYIRGVNQRLKLGYREGCSPGGGARPGTNGCPWLGMYIPGGGPMAPGTPMEGGGICDGPGNPTGAIGVGPIAPGRIINGITPPGMPKFGINAIHICDKHPSTKRAYWVVTGVHWFDTATSMY